MNGFGLLLNPPTPVIISVPQAFEAGQSVEIKGLIIGTPEQASFAINLRCGLDNNESNINLHFNPRFNEGQVVLNTLSANGWGAEERFSNPFRLRQIFEVRISALKSNFIITVNGELFCEYRYRMSLNTIKTLHISGCVKLTSILFERQQLTSHAQISFRSNIDKLLKPSVPHTVCLTPWGLGRIAFIKGIPTGNRININFQRGYDIWFHIGIRLDEKAIVRNTRRGLNWETEEREIPSFPFSKSAVFEIVIACEINYHQVQINRIHFFNFYHRSPPQTIENLEITQDINLLELHLA